MPKRRPVWKLPNSPADKKPEPFVNPPGPFTTRQLIPPSAISQVKAHAAAVQACLQRSKRGKSGWREGKKLRPGEGVDPEAEGGQGEVGETEPLGVRKPLWVVLEHKGLRGEREAR